MENRIKEQQLFLFADRTSTHMLRSSQFRVLFSTVAYLLHQALRTFGLQRTTLAKTHVETSRTKLLQIGGRIGVSVRRVVLSLSKAYPWRRVFAQLLQILRRP